jgi:hypothetical protein
MTFQKQLGSSLFPTDFQPIIFRVGRKTTNQIGIPSEIILLNFYNGLGWIMGIFVASPVFTGCSWMFWDSNLANGYSPFIDMFFPIYTLVI